MPRMTNMEREIRATATLMGYVLTKEEVDRVWATWEQLMMKVRTARGGKMGAMSDDLASGSIRTAITAVKEGDKQKSRAESN